MPLKLDSGWNEIRFDLSDFCRRSYATDVYEVCRVTIHANCRLRRVYFADKSYREEELPTEFKLYKVVASEGKNKSQVGVGVGVGVGEEPQSKTRIQGKENDGSMA